MAARCRDGTAVSRGRCFGRTTVEGGRARLGLWLLVPAVALSLATCEHQPRLPYPTSVTLGPLSRNSSSARGSVAVLTPASASSARCGSWETEIVSSSWKPPRYGRPSGHPTARWCATWKAREGRASLQGRFGVQVHREGFFAIDAEAKDSHRFQMTEPSLRRFRFRAAPWVAPDSATRPCSRMARCSRYRSSPARHVGIRWQPPD